MRNSLLLMCSAFWWIAQAQCPPGDLGKGQFLPTPSGCATYGLDIIYQPIYNNLDDNAQIVIDWGDGTPNTIIDIGTTGSQAGIFYNTPSPHTYTEDNTSAGCVYTITSYVISGCYTQEETTVAEDIVVWNTDNFGDGNSDLATAPAVYEVCAGSAALVNFQDVSPWNCTDLMVTTSVNDQPRWTQWIYGYFNNITGTVTVNGNDEAPYPFPGPINDHTGAQVLNPVAPGNESLEIFVPATAQVGEEFHVRLNNWNQCNLYEDGGGNPTGNNPVFRDAVIRVVAPPAPDFQTRLNDATGPVQTNFCLQEDIYFENLTGGGNNYLWEFFDDSLGTQLINTANATNPTFAFDSPGRKLIRLTASNANVAGCNFTIERTVQISPDAIAQIEFYDSAFLSPIDPRFCQDATTDFYVGLRDATTNIEPATVWRWEFLDPNNTLLQSFPPGAGTFSAVQQSDTVLAFRDLGYTIVRLIARNSVTLCESVNQDTIFINPAPNPSFQANTVCEGNATTFSSITEGAGPWINGDSVAIYEWDLDYDGAFAADTTSTSGDPIEWLMGRTTSDPNRSVPGSYQVALQLTTSLGNCSATHIENVEVLPLPPAQLSLSTNVSCPGDELMLENISFDTDSTADYTLSIVHNPSNYSVSVPFNTADSTLAFYHTDDSVRTYRFWIESSSMMGCANVSDTLSLQVPPIEQTDFGDSNYSFLTANCSPWSSTFIVDPSTRTLDPDAYTWTLTGSDGNVVEGYPITKVRSDTGFHQLDYTLVNNTGAIQSYQMILETTKQDACFANDTFDIRISPQPEARFTVEREETCDEVLFTFEASQKGLDYYWQFDPMPALLTADDELRFALYERPGIDDEDLSVNVSLVTTNLADCASEPYTESLSIANQNFDIIALFELSTDTLQLPEATITLTNRSTLGAAYRWDFGDGDTSLGYTPEPHTYTEPGQFQLTLTVDNGICEEDYSRILTVLPPDPVIDFEATPLFGCSPLTVKFQNTSTDAQNGRFLWEFGDGAISTQDEPTHTYTQGGLYTVRLRGENEQGVVIEHEKTDYIEVLPSPFADFLATPRVVYIPDQQVFFRNLSRDGTSFIWDFGDGQRSEAFEPRHAYTEEGFYDITLIVANDQNCIDTLYRPTEVQAIKGGSVQTPNAFTPSLSGPSGGELGFMGNSNPSRLNDVFLPKLEGVSKFKMSVYNKWGQLLFTSDSQTRGWDGYYRGQLAPAGVYVYKLQLTYSDGREEVKAGDLTLIR